MVEGTDATLQEVAALRERFGGDQINLYPLGRLAVWFPRLLYGCVSASRLRKAAGRHLLVHLYHACPYGFPVMRLSRRPAIFTVTAGLCPNGNRGDRGSLNGLRCIVVSDKGERETLREQGYDNIEVVRPAIDSRSFKYTPRPPDGTIRLLLGSSPWTKGQFMTKGINAALEAARRDPSLEITFLWRGSLAADLEKAAADHGVSSRIRIINHRTDVNEILGSVSAAAVFVRNPAEIRAYPHSLMESLAAGKPVIVSENIPMSRYVRDRGCGVVTAGATAEHLLEAVEELKNSYTQLQERALEAGKEISLSSMLKSYENLYRKYSG